MSSFLGRKADKRGMRKSLFACALIVSGCIGCAKPASDEKYVPSVWTANDGSKTIDLRPLKKSLGVTADVTIELLGGEVCGCRFSYGGVGSRNWFEFSSCHFVSGGADPGCSQLSESGMYINENKTLVLCEDYSRKNCAHYF